MYKYLLCFYLYYKYKKIILQIKQKEKQINVSLMIIYQWYLNKGK